MFPYGKMSSKQVKKKRKTAKMFGMAIFYSSIQAAIGSVEMSSRFSVINFSKDQSTLQNAANALKSYLIMASIWTLATVLVMFAQFGWLGALVGTVANFAYMLWIYISYLQAFRKATQRYGLHMPRVW